ncbi:hypothetical protein LBMAG52_01570 [Planctomycetia bacterium]|nr:hypothetical protein LBMAG52_01570 [Planctomycetia bacterium]
MSAILWIIGAGASKHLGMPLLTEFRSFFREIWWKFPENRVDIEIQSFVPCAIGIMDSYPDLNMEQLLLPTSPLTEANRNVLKQAIRRTFERRQLGRIAKLIHSPTPGIRYKFDAYARLLCCMDDGDAIVSFNYDNAFEYVVSCISGDFSLLNVSELSPKQLSALSNKGRKRWIPLDLHDSLRQRQIRYSPVTSFDGDLPTYGSGTKVIDLIKIHGSINWFASGDNRIHVGSPRSDSSIPLMAYPEPNKPETKVPPFSVVMDEAKTSLQKFNRIVIIGYSFPQSDSTGHPFVGQLAQIMKQKRVLAVDPYPGAGLREALKTADSRFIEKSFESAFNCQGFERSDLSESLSKFRKS